MTILWCPHPLVTPGCSPRLRAAICPGSRRAAAQPVVLSAEPVPQEMRDERASQLLLLPRVMPPEQQQGASQEKLPQKHHTLFLNGKLISNPGNAGTAHRTEGTHNL